jgi:hypothetical protein
MKWEYNHKWLRSDNVFNCLHASNACRTTVILQLNSDVGEVAACIRRYLFMLLIIKGWKRTAYMKLHANKPITWKIIQWLSE